MKFLVSFVWTDSASKYGVCVEFRIDRSTLFSRQVLAACVAVSSAQLVAYPNGAVTPIDTPEVQAAKAAFAAAGGAINPVAYAGYPYAGLPYAYAAGYPFGGLVAHPNGAVVPVDEPAVAAAKAEFAAAGGVINPVGAVAYAGYPYVAGLPYAGLVAHPNGAVVPAEPADVVAARAEHLAAHASA